MEYVYSIQNIFYIVSCLYLINQIFVNCNYPTASIVSPSSSVAFLIVLSPLISLGQIKTNHDLEGDLVIPIQRYIHPSMMYSVICIFMAFIKTELNGFIAPKTLNYLAFQSFDF